jgi:hypothetical protein
MYALPIGTLLASQATATVARSALPDAPAVPDDRTSAFAPVRHATATGLRRLANRLAAEGSAVPAGAHAGR